MNRCHMLWYTTLCRALRGTCWVGWFVRTRRVRHGYASEPFLCIPLASSSVPEASLLSSGLRLYRTLIRCYRGCQSPPEEGSCTGAGSRWCFHLLGTFPQDPYAAYVSRRYAADARDGLREARSDPGVATNTGSGKGLSVLNTHWTTYSISIQISVISHTGSRACCGATHWAPSRSS